MIRLFSNRINKMKEVPDWTLKNLDSVLIGRNSVLIMRMITHMES